MAKLHYVSPMSLDGYIGDGHYDWSGPAEGSTAFITEIIRPFGTYLYGRRNYETMSVWDSADFVSKLGSDDHEFARVWQAAEKVIYSKSLQNVTTKNTRLVSDFDAQEIREMKAQSPSDLCIGGPTLAAQAIRAGLVDEVHLFVVTATLGGESRVIPVLPRDRSIFLDLLEVRPFSKGWVYLRYRIRPEELLL
ncbi:MAG TPA: dihydrofolate reductase family protein [Pseudobdellovibrionaceae bacterium]|nr:dihydrofolate reductase family protein [Pseudobdellovibrionaceae bacterium]